MVIAVIALLWATTWIWVPMLILFIVGVSSLDTYTNTLERKRRAR